jgi:hypothetical protein|tara:strand:+ start:1424 stop:1597 length:174 start_codon:yes stop_codon:yes gene_type:complete
MLNDITIDLEKDPGRIKDFLDNSIIEPTLKLIFLSKINNKLVEEIRIIKEKEITKKI